MTTFVFILVSVLLVSLISFIGVFFLALKEKALDKLLGVFVSFASGSLLGSAFFHLLPESVEELGDKTFTLVIISFLLFFVLEKFLSWRHCHRKHCETHSFAYLNLIGDGVHNFIDGAIITVSFLTNFSLGISTTLAIILHEIPQEIGDFSILVYGGFGKKKALMFNFISALTAVLGAMGVYFFSGRVSGLIPFFLPLAAGGFIYIAATDLMPELHKREEVFESVVQLVAMAGGVILMGLLRTLL